MPAAAAVYRLVEGRVSPRMAALAAAGATAGAMRIGMDDPSLADKVRGTGLDPTQGGSAQALTYRVAVDAADQAAFPHDADVAEPSGAEAGAPLHREADRSSDAPFGAFGKAVLVIASTALGAATGFLVARDMNFDFPVEASAAAGGVFGLVVAWGWLRWISRQG